MQIQMDRKESEALVANVVDGVSDVLAEALKSRLESHFAPDRLLKREEVCELMLNCAMSTADTYFLNAKGFPYVMVGSHKRYPRKAVEDWIQKNTRYNA